MTFAQRLVIDRRRLMQFAAAAAASLAAARTARSEPVELDERP